MMMSSSSMRERGGSDSRLAANQSGGIPRPVCTGSSSRAQPRDGGKGKTQQGHLAM